VQALGDFTLSLFGDSTPAITATVSNAIVRTDPVFMVGSLTDFLQPLEHLRVRSP
jgi:hypothetical protein